MMGKSHLTNLIILCDETTSLVDRGVVYLNLNKGFAVSHDIPIDKLITFGQISGKWAGLKLLVLGGCDQKHKVHLEAGDQQGTWRQYWNQFW